MGRPRKLPPKSNYHSVPVTLDEEILLNRVRTVLQRTAGKTKANKPYKIKTTDVLRHLLQLGLESWAESDPDMKL